MDNNILKKKLNTFKTAKGSLKNVSDDVAIEVLRTWEHWPGKSAELYRELSLSRMQLVNMIKKAKRLIKNGMVTESEFKEIKVQAPQETGPLTSPIILKWQKDKIIRFYDVDHLVDFLKKAA